MPNKCQLSGAERQLGLGWCQHGLEMKIIGRTAPGISIDTLPLSK